MIVLEILRIVVFAAFALAAATALGSWAVRTKRLSPFGKTAHYIRRTTDPLLRPIEHWLLRRGGNPQHAEWWLLGGAVVGGIIIITLAEWLVRQLGVLAGAGAVGPGALIKVGIYYAGQVVTIALVVRVIGSWFGATRYTPLMRVFYVLTDWIVEPLRRIVPRFGAIDVTPIIAWFLIQIVVNWIMRL